MSSILPNLQKGHIVLWLSEHGEQFVRPQSFEANSVPVRKYSVPSSPVATGGFWEISPPPNKAPSPSKLKHEIL